MTVTSPALAGGRGRAGA